MNYLGHCGELNFLLNTIYELIKGILICFFRSWLIVYLMEVSKEGSMDGEANQEFLDMDASHQESLDMETGQELETGQDKKGGLHGCVG